METSAVKEILRYSKRKPFTFFTCEELPLMGGSDRIGFPADSLALKRKPPRTTRACLSFARAGLDTRDMPKDIANLLPGIFALAE